MVSARRMREVDRLAQTRYRIPEAVLMEHAGAALAAESVPFWAGRRGSVWVFAGGGANGGDGFVAARHLDNWGVPVRVLLIGDAARITGAAAQNLRMLRPLRVPFDVIRSLSAWKRWESTRRKIGLAVDALLGTGVSGIVREPLVSAIRWLNLQRFPVVSADLPSGLSADTGKACGTAVQSDCTVTFGLPKTGLFRNDGPRCAGRVVVADIGLPRRLRR